MKRRNVRVIVASESTETCHLLEKIVVRGGGVTVGEAPDAPKALSLIRNLKPDVAIIDCYLPYVSSMHAASLSHLGGLDIAQMITEERSSTRVVLLNNLDTAISDRAVALEKGVTYSMRDIERNMPLVVGNLSRTETPSNNLVFADVEARQNELPSNPTNPFDVVIFGGVCGVAIGWFLIVCMISFNVGGIIALAGISTIVLGMAGKFIASMSRKLLDNKRAETGR